LICAARRRTTGATNADSEPQTRFQTVIEEGDDWFKSPISGMASKLFSNKRRRLHTTGYRYRRALLEVISIANLWVYLGFDQCCFLGSERRKRCLSQVTLLVVSGHCGLSSPGRDYWESTPAGRSKGAPQSHQGRCLLKRR
jgi:hypothetical protein